MGRINGSRVVLGGLLAGLVINVGEFILNVPILGAEMEEALRAVNRPPIPGNVIGLFVVMGFALGIGTVWLYAAIRPRFGPGPRTAMIAGLAVWGVVYFYGAMVNAPLGFFPVRLYAISVVWGLFEAPLAALAGAWLYRED